MCSLVNSSKARCLYIDLVLFITIHECNINRPLLTRGKRLSISDSGSSVRYSPQAGNSMVVGLNAIVYHKIGRGRQVVRARGTVLSLRGSKEDLVYHFSWV